MKIIKNYINGQHVIGGAGLHPKLYPASGEKIFDVSYASEQDCDNAIAAAKEGFKIWSTTSPAIRASVLRRAAAILRERLDELAIAEVYDTGKPLIEAQSDDIISAVDCFEYMSAQAATLHAHQYDFGESFAYTRHEPLGVCVGIGAWNYPIQLVAWKAAPCLAAGNAMVYKPSEMTPSNSLALAEILSEAGLPAGVFNVVQGDGLIGRFLAEHPDVSKVSMTGSIASGLKVASSAAKSMKKTTLELGGKSPLIIFDDADLNSAVSAALCANFYSQGENCCNGTRVFVHEDIYDVFCEKVSSAASALIVGDPMDLATQIGSLISPAHQTIVSGYIAQGIAQGANLLCGGDVVHVDGMPGGSFMQPTVFSNCTDDMSIVREEIFGPVMSILRFSSEEEVLMRANNTEFGLAAGVFTMDIKRGHRVVNRLQAGVCWINSYNYLPAELPFGGYKQSGMGRENGAYALREYTQVKSVYVELGEPSFPYPV
jgi:betaine-aldehyde dehydrogenase